MAGRGFVAEGWLYSQNGNAGPRYNDTLFRGTATFTGSTTITLPLPIRFAGFAQATLVLTTAPTATTASIVTVGTFSANTFKIFAWEATATAGTWAAAGSACTVNWTAYGSVTDNFVSGAY